MLVHVELFNTHQKSAPQSLSSPRPDEFVDVARQRQVRVPLVSLRTVLVVVRVVHHGPDDVEGAQHQHRHAQTQQRAAQTSQGLEREGICASKMLDGCSESVLEQVDERVSDVTHLPSPTASWLHVTPNWSKSHATVERN